jgi:hypothetical protein
MLALRWTNRPDSFDSDSVRDRGIEGLPRRSFSEGGFKSFRPDQFLTISAKSSLPEHSVPPLFDGEIINATPQDVVARLSKRGAAILRLPPFH